MGAVVRWVFDPTTSETPIELHAAHICDAFHCTPDDYERNKARYDLWFLLLNQERTARQVKDQGWKGIPPAWQKEYEEFIPDGMDVEQIKALRGTIG